jgi:hypothetical protein
MDGHVAHKGEMRDAYKIFVGIPERKRPVRKLSVGGIKILR